ncbi:hypothetical protein DVS28_a0040 [Euzebya pacifica]|uniref:Uncharacterized protein n=1 Tax=Euzebya pacifica TaxID=1608957 RepID=A0A346XRA1_9ACTN|nr:hypothetical protein DVS28_a0040 [Euzebya pacifica]
MGDAGEQAQDSQDDQRRGKSSGGAVHAIFSVGQGLLGAGPYPVTLAGPGKLADRSGTGTPAGEGSGGGDRPPVWRRHRMGAWTDRRRRVVRRNGQAVTR